MDYAEDESGIWSLVSGNLKMAIKNVCLKIVINCSESSCLFQEDHSAPGRK